MPAKDDRPGDRPRTLEIALLKDRIALRDIQAQTVVASVQQDEQRAWTLFVAEKEAPADCEVVAELLLRRLLDAGYANVPRDQLLTTVQAACMPRAGVAPGKVSATYNPLRRPDRENGNRPSV